MTKNLIIRDNLATDILEIDRLDKQPKKSREQYLRDLIHQHAQSKFLVEQANHYGTLVQENMNVIHQNNILMKKLIELFKGENGNEI